MTEDEAKALRQKIVEITYEEINGDGESDKEGRQILADRIIVEIIAPIQRIAYETGYKDREPYTPIRL